MSRSVVVKLLRSAALVVFLSYSGIGVLLWFAQGSLIFQGAPDVDRDPSSKGWTFDEIRIPVMGDETHGWYIPLENARGAVLFSHGNAGNISGRLSTAETLRGFGLSVLVYDYGGYGESTGTASEARCNADIRAMWTYLTEEKGVPAKDIILYGRSLGGGPTADLAKDVMPGGVVLESTFLSITDMAWGMPVYRPWVWLLRHRFATKDKIGDFTAPLLLMSSKDDEVVPYAHGQELFRRAKEPKTFVELKGGHNYAAEFSGERYTDAWKAFLDTVLAERRSPVG